MLTQTERTLIDLARKTESTTIHVVADATENPDKYAQTHTTLHPNFAVNFY